MKQVKVIITDKGVKLETDGFVGESCLEASEELMKNLDAVGIKPKEPHIELKEEYYVKENSHAKNKQ